MNMNMNKTPQGLVLNNTNRCHLCPQNNATNISNEKTQNLNKEINFNNYVSNQQKFVISPSFPPR